MASVRSRRKAPDIIAPIVGNRNTRRVRLR